MQVVTLPLGHLQTEMMAQSGSKSSLQVLSCTVAGKLLNMAVLFLVTPILGPEGFGQLLIVGIIFGFFGIVVDVGFENYYIMKVKLHGPSVTPAAEVKEIEDVVFNLRLYSNIFFFFVQQLIATFGKGWLFEAPVDVYLRILSLNYLIAIVGRINEVRLRKHMNFKPIAIAKVASDAFGSLVKVGLIYSGMGIVGWAIGLVAANLAYAFMLFRFGNYRPVLVGLPKKWRSEIIWYAKHSWLSGAGNYFHWYISNIILNKFYPLRQAGYIQFAHSYTLEVQSGLLSSQLHVQVPYIANFQHDRLRIRAGLQQYVSLGLFLFGFPAIFGMLYSKEVVQVLFGEKWMAAHTILAIYCAYILIRIIFSPALGILTSLGRMRESSMVAFFSLAMLGGVMLTVALAGGSIYHYALAFVLVNLLTEAVKASVGLWFLKISLWDVISDAEMSIAALLAVFALLMLQKEWVSPDGWFGLALSAAFGVVIFLAIQFVLNRSVYGAILDKFRIMGAQFLKK
jgi:O-antigen/teichoic acid export membrane protein